MKKLALIAAVAVAAGTSMGMTVKDSGNCGCGLGSMALGDQEATVLSQLCATFLNGICGNGTFGITSGTLDCKPASAVVFNSRVQQYVADNMDQVALEMALGRGESLNAMADLMQVPANARKGMFTKLQNNFDRIFTSEDVSADVVVKNMASLLKS